MQKIQLATLSSVLALNAKAFSLNGEDNLAEA